MPLDAHSAAILAARRRAALPPVSGMTVAQVRASRKSWQQCIAVPAVPVSEVRDMLLCGATGTVPARVYRPSNQSDLPVVAYFHGGGWVIGDLDHSDPVCRFLCRESGCVVVNVDYRLAPEHRYPAAVEDAYFAVTWLSAHATEIGGDAARVAVAGASSGGNLAAVAALMSRDRGGPRLRAQLLVYPVTDAACASPSYDEFGDGYIVSTDDMRWYWRQYLDRPQQADEPYASPLRCDDLGGLPPALIITAECDPIRDEGERYGERLGAAGVVARVSRYPGTLHGFFGTPGVNDKATQAVREAAAFLRGAFEGGRP